MTLCIRWRIKWMTIHLFQHIHTVCPNLTVLYWTGAKNESELIEHIYSHGCQNSCATSDNTLWSIHQPKLLTKIWRLNAENYSRLLASVAHIWGRVTCQLYTLTTGENCLLSPTWNVSKGVFDVFSLAQSFIFSTYYVHLCGYPRILQVFPIWESFFVTRTTISPHHDSNAWIILDLTLRSLSPSLFVALGRHVPGRNQVRRGRSVET